MSDRERVTRLALPINAVGAVEDRSSARGPDTVLAFIMEPIGGLASGATIASAAYYEEVRAICDRHGVLLIYDEVMSGAGRTGTFLAADHWPAVRPDLVTLAKGIAAGYTPFGAVLAPDRIVDAVVEAGGFMGPAARTRGRRARAGAVTAALVPLRPR